MNIVSEALADGRGLGLPAAVRVFRVTLAASFVALAGVAVAYLVASGRWYVVLGLLLVVPAFVILHRYPLASLIVWMLLAPLVAETDDAAVRKVFWLVHRALPVAALTAVMFSSILGIRSRKLPRLGWPELLMAGYVVATLLSIAYTSRESLATVYVLYDRVFIPMCLYLIVRLLEPDERDFKRLLPAVAFVLLSQSLLGLLSWVAPEVLPSEWLGKLGERTVGSLRSPNVFGATVLFCAMFVLHSGMTVSRSIVGRVSSVLLFVLGLLMAFLTLSRATWLAGLVALCGTLYFYRKFVKQLAVMMVMLILLVITSGLMGEQIESAGRRLHSEQAEESALSRLPVAYAAIRMFEVRPIVGWGYGNFDLFDREFQARVGNLVSPDKDHASHNLYLTILAEQGLVGFVLFIGPMVYWLLRTRRSVANMPATGLVDRRFPGMLWLGFACFVIVNNFSSMHVTFGLGLWWLTLGLIGSIVHRYSRQSARLLSDSGANR